LVTRVVVWGLHLQAEQKRQSELRDIEAKLSKMASQMQLLLQQGEHKRAPVLCSLCQDKARDCMCVAVRIAV
jgi:hypothetical protein